VSLGPLCSRYGDPKLCTEKSDKAFAERFQRDCSLTFLQATLEQLAVLARGGYQSPRVINLLLAYITQVGGDCAHPW
jgi:hypothetical protein